MSKCVNLPLTRLSPPLERGSDLRGRVRFGTLWRPSECLFVYSVHLQRIVWLIVARVARLCCQKSREVSQQQQERSRTRIVRQLPQTRAVPPDIQQRMAPALQQRTAAIQKRTVSAPQRTVSVGQRTVRTVSASPQRSVNGEQSGGSVSSSSERLSQRERPGLQQRTTLTAKQRERESEYQRQIKERDSEIKRLKERMKVISDKLSKKNELQVRQLGSRSVLCY